LKRIVPIFVLFCFCLLFFSASAEEIVTEATEAETTDEMIIGISETGGEADLASAYIMNAMPHRRILRISLPSGLRLPEPDRSLYVALRTLVSEVAAGEKGSTDFAIPYGEVFKNSFTAEELGVTTIIEDGSITQEAKSAAMAAMLQNRSQLHPSDAVICLIADSPYELYWYDKSEGHGTKVGYESKSYAASSTTITVKGNILVRMSVSRDYAMQSEIAGGEIVYSEYEMDTSYGAGVQAAAENAAAILEENRNKSDEEKLASYRDAICGLADYNNDASESDPYGDPWQLVWVFDGKPNTKVVCEGYAKAFQYLCDQGTKAATAISIQGQTNGPHMWNVVSIGGHHYLVDLTNYDLGYDLFMKGYTDGDAATGYTIRFDKGTVKYIYNEGQSWTEEDLTLYPMDYAEWKAAVEKAPEVQMSNGVLFPGYAAGVRVMNENPVFPDATLMIHRVSGGDAGEDGEESAEELPLENGIGLIFDAGTYTFTMIRDGVESPSTEPVTLAADELPEGPILHLPAGAEIQAEAFAGNESLVRIEAEGCVFRAGAFAGSPVVLARLTGECTVEPGAFEDSVVVGLDEGADWMDGVHFLFADGT